MRPQLQPLPVLPMHVARKFRSSLSALRGWAISFGLLFAGLASVHAQVVRLEGLDDPGYAWSRSWIDVNGDGRDDYCLLAGTSGEQLQCYLSDGTTFGPTKQIYTAPAGTGSTGYAVRWLDINGDGYPDLCRTTGNPPAGTPSIGGLNCRFGPNFTSATSVTIPFVSTGGGLTDWSHAFTVDVNGDGRTDVCYLHVASPTTTLKCFLSNGSGFDAPIAAWTSMPIDGGLLYPTWPRGFVDFNGDGFPDFCRLVSTTQFKCLLGGPNGFKQTDVASPAISIPYKEGASFVDVNGDGKTDFCRIVGASSNYALSCLVSNGVGWETVERTSPIIGNTIIGDQQMRWWIDINADGLPDFCRAVSSSRLSCRLSRGDGDGVSNYAFGFSDVYIDGIDFGISDGGRSFCDASGSGILTFCRATLTHPGTTQVCSYGGGDSGETVCWTVPTDSNGIVAGLVVPASATDNKLQARLPLLTAFSDGVGAETRISYLPLTNTQVYTRSGPGTFPRALISQPRSSVVYETRSWRTGTSEPMTGIARYFFKDLRNDTWLGSRGFRERWIFTEASNSLEHITFYQGLGSAFDTDSVSNDRREIGLIKQQERFAVANGYLPNPTTSAAAPSIRAANMKNIMSAAGVSAQVQLVPTPQSPFVLLHRTTNTLADTVPVNPRYRFIGSATAQSWDWNNETLATVPLPTLASTTTMTNVGNVTGIVQTTTANGLVWSQTTTNEYDPAKQNPSAWILGRLTKATVTSVSPTEAAQLGAYSSSAGRSPDAGSTSGTTPAAPQPINPAVLSAILQLLLDD
jgi:hypothetical protein